MLEISSDALQSDRCAALRELAARYDCHVVLKGSHTLVGGIAVSVYVNSSGNPHLAQGGSGDVLAGFIGGWLAQPWAQLVPERALNYAVWSHGSAADFLSSQATGWGMDELIAALK
jgi:NAD(P)H-hydrate epimerase